MSLRISIVTPSYNQGRYIQRTIQSVLSQEYDNLEYVVVDGASTDETLSVVNRYLSRLTWFVSEPDGGQAQAIEKGFAQTSGDILGWLNSDDVLLPGSLAAVSQYFAQHPEVEVVSGGAYYIDENTQRVFLGKCSYSLGVAATYNRLRIYGQEGIFQCATFWRRDAYTAVGGLNVGLAFIMDLDLFTRLAKRRRFGRLPKFLAAFRVHKAAKTHLLHRVHDEELKRYKLVYTEPGESVLANRMRAWWYHWANRVRRGALFAADRLGLIRFPTLLQPGGEHVEK